MPLCVVFMQPPVEVERRLAWLTLLAWLLQAGSGAAFGVVSFYYYGEFPDIYSIALGALWLKIACAVSGCGLGAFYLGAGVSGQVRSYVWRAKAALGVTALTAAAVLRWFS